MIKEFKRFLCFACEYYGSEIGGLKNITATFDTIEESEQWLKDSGYSLDNSWFDWYQIFDCKTRKIISS